YLREMYDEKLRALTYGGVKQIDDFSEAASEVFRIFVDIFPNDLAERRACTRQRMKTGKLPSHLTKPLMDKASTLKHQKATDRVQAVEAHEDTDDDTNPVKQRQADSVAALAQQSGARLPTGPRSTTPKEC
ncbi:hypothetical protein FOZ62_016754, partial [Perkinsus olseni]